MLTENAILVADGGGKVRSIWNPVYGSDKITRFFLGVGRKVRLDVRVGMVNSGVGMLAYSDGRLVSVAAVELEGDRIRAIYSVSNPDKIGGLL